MLRLLDQARLQKAALILNYHKSIDFTTDYVYSAACAGADGPGWNGFDNFSPPV